MIALVKKDISMMEKILYANNAYLNAKIVFNQVLVHNVRIIWMQIVNANKDIFSMDNNVNVYSIINYLTLHYGLLYFYYIIQNVILSVNLVNKIQIIAYNVVIF